MTNTNCLEGLKCPRCGNEDRLNIVGTSLFSVTDDGTEFHNDVEWDDDSPCECPDCRFEAKLKDFRSSGLPPDPDGKNEDRANWALGALQEFMKLTGTEPEDAISDLLCDLMHLSDRREKGVEDFASALDRARFHYEAETNGDES